MLSPNDPSPHVCVLDRQIVLALNKHWAPLGTKNVRDAFVSLSSESVHDEKAAVALDITIEVDDTGNVNLISAIPTPLDAWLKLPVREGDLYVLTKNGKVRAPTVIVSRQHDRVPLKMPRLSSKGIWDRDGSVCQYTGQKVTRSNANIDHVVPRDRGGKDTWDNMVVSLSELNRRKGNRLNSEIGLKLLREPKAPKAIPVSASITEAKHPTWIPFLIR